MVPCREGCVLVSFSFLFSSACGPRKGRQWWRCNGREGGREGGGGSLELIWREILGSFWKEGKRRRGNRGRRRKKGKEGVVSGSREREQASEPL